MTSLHFSSKTNRKQFLPQFSLFDLTQFARPFLLQPGNDARVTWKYINSFATTLFFQ